MIDLKESIKFFLGKKLNLYPSNLDLFISAFTHGSYKFFDPAAQDYERLELLGDSLISLIITENLYRDNYSLKDICNKRKSMISGTSLTWVAKHLCLDEYIRLGKSCSITNSILEDAYEALIGAIYLVEGYTKTKEIVEDTLYKNYLDGKLPVFIDYKTELQEWFQSKPENKGKRLIYRNEGKDVDGCCVVSVKCLDRELGRSKGCSVKESEQLAARDVLIKFNILGH